MARRLDQELTGANNSDNNNINHYNSVIREHMFDKVVTPSDVGKLNRLVIPKQHAENYFPLDDNQNGTVLDFQDRNGKVWRFRYSYWTSSQSYVMTKGWSRFVKDKKLDAGDTVSFHRGYVADVNQPENRRKVMFIDWRHRAEISLHNINQHFPMFRSFSTDFYPTEYSIPNYRSFPPVCYNQREVLGYDYNRVAHGGGSYFTADVRNLTSEIIRSSPLDHHQWNLERSEPLIFDSYPVFPAARMNPPAPPQMAEGASTTKKLRLFGVDVEESSSSGETHGEMGFGGTSSSPVMTRDDDRPYWRSPRGEMGASSSSWVMQLSDDEEYKRKGKSIYNK